MIHLLGLQPHKTACHDVLEHGDSITVLFQKCTCSGCLIHRDEFEAAYAQLACPGTVQTDQVSGKGGAS